MPITPTEQSHAVALALGLWKEGEKCDYVRSYNSATWTCNLHRRNGPHDIPPPDLTSPQGADALMTACEARHFHIEQFVEETQSVCYLTEETVEPTHFVEGTGPNWRLALLDAAYQLLCAKE